MSTTKALFGEHDLVLGEVKNFFGELCAFLYCNMERYLDYNDWRIKGMMGMSEKFPSLQIVVQKVGQSLIKKITETEQDMRILEPKEYNSNEDGSEWVCEACEWANQASC